MRDLSIRLWIGVLVCLSCPIYAQNDTLKSEKHLQHYISISPLAIFSGIFRADYEYILKDKHYGIVATALLGSTEHVKNDYTFVRSSGGIEIGNKLYSTPINDTEQENGSFYLNMGLRYQHFQFKYEDHLWKSQMDDSTGLQVYRLDKGMIYPAAHRFSLVPQVGVVVRYNRFMLDIYYGVSLYREIIKNNINKVELPLNNWSNVGMHHMTMFAGVKLGVVLK